MASDSEIEFSGGHDGLDDAAAVERAELVRWLRSKGITEEEIGDATSPMLLASRRLIGDDGTYVSTRDIAEKTGMDLELVQRVQRAVGLPTVDDVDAAVYLRSDGEAVAHTGRFIDLGFDAEQLLRVTRTLAEGLSNAAETMRSAALANVLQPGASELDIARGSEHLVAAVAPLLGPMVEDMLLLQLRHAMETEAVNATERAAGEPLPGAREVAIAFADLVGFTRLGEETPPEELERLANRLGDMARDVAAPPVRFIKTIGDAVMLVCPEPLPLLRAMLTLAGAAGADEDFPRLRVGIAFGAAVSRAGDWFGSPVNIASRVTSAARPGAVLVTESVRESIGEADGIDWSFAGAKKLKGIKGDTKLYRARQSGTE